MMDPDSIHELMIESLRRVKGLKRVSALRDEDRQAVLDKEREAEERSLMGLGKVVNSGVNEIVNCHFVYAALTDMDFDWGCYCTLVLKKGEEIVGEEVRDPDRIAELSTDKNVWFLHKNFVIYKDRITFPQDIMQKICHFDIPCLPADFCPLTPDRLQSRSILFAIPSTPCDLYLKKQHFDMEDEKGSGTILIGVQL